MNNPVLRMNVMDHYYNGRMSAGRSAAKRINCKRAGWNMRSDARNVSRKSRRERKTQRLDINGLKRKQNERSNKYKQGSSEEWGHESQSTWRDSERVLFHPEGFRGFSGWWGVLSDSISISRRSPWFHPARYPAEMSHRTWRRWRLSDRPECKKTKVQMHDGVDLKLEIKSWFIFISVSRKKMILGASIHNTFIDVPSGTVKLVDFHPNHILISLIRD